MSDAGLPNWARGVAIAQTTATVYAALGASCGAILYLIAPYFHGNPWGWFFAGMAIPPGPLYLIYTSDWMFERRIKKLKQWRDEDLIPFATYEESLKRAIFWRDERLYGKPAGPGRTSPTRSRVRKKAPLPPADPTGDLPPPSPSGPSST